MPHRSYSIWLGLLGLFAVPAQERKEVESLRQRAISLLARIRALTEK